MIFNTAEIDKDPKQKDLWNKMLAAVKECAREKWGDKIPKGLQSPFRNGEEKEQYEGYGPGVIFVTAKSERRPKVVDQRVKEILDPEDFYPGCYAHADVNPYAWEFMGKSGVAIGLGHIQKIEDGEHIGGGPSAESSFDAIEGAETEEASSSNATALFE
jgi:hypothetical protein